MAWHGVGVTDIGRVRQSNQDALAVLNDLNLWIVADGMGGHAGGDVASQLTVESIESYFRQHHSSAEGLREPRTAPTAILRAGIESANQAVRTRAKLQSELAGMGTTVVLLYISKDSPFPATIAHVGDSRAYLLRDGTITPLTRDHTLMEDRIKLGILTREQAMYHPLRHILTKGVGIERTAGPDISTHHLLPGDRVLLCTDGLCKTMNDEQILQTVQSTEGKSLEAVCQLMIREANRLGGEDNITVVLVSHQDTG